MNQMPCSATVAERDTDAGTKPLIEVDAPEDNPYLKGEIEDEVRHIASVIAGLRKDTDRVTGETRSIRLDNEIAGSVIDRAGLIEELVTLVCAGRVGAFTVTDAMIVDKFAGAVWSAIGDLAEQRVRA